MKLECSVFIGMRRRQGGDCKLGRPSRCFLGLGKSRPMKDGEDIRFHLLVQYQCRKPEKFQINKETVQSVLKGQVKSGKATILLSAPPVNIYISEADSGKLSIFLRCFEQVVSKNELDERQILQSWETNCSKSEIATANTRRLSIAQRKDYPRSDGFPPSLRELHVNGVGLKSVDIRWFSLSQLVILDLSANRLGVISDPIEWRKFESIRRLTRLEELNLSENNFSRRLPAELVNALPQSLRTLNLSRNFITELPNEICQLHNLHSLLLNYNQLTELPEDLCLLPELRVLSVSDNDLITLPATLFTRRYYGRFQHLDLSNNHSLRGDSIKRRRLFFWFDPPTLITIAAAAFLNLNIVLEPDFLPRELNASMRSWLRRCSTCYRLFPQEKFDGSTKLVNVEMIRFSSNTYSGPQHLNLEQYFCVKCVK